MLSNVHQQFGLSVDKIVGTVTDNASNFGKAFRIFSFDKEEIEEEPEYLQNEDDVVISEFELPNNFDDDLEEFALPTQY
ncbi:transposase orf2, partial [Lasius niger]